MRMMLRLRRNWVSTSRVRTKPRRGVLDDPKGFQGPWLCVGAGDSGLQSLRMSSFTRYRRSGQAAPSPSAKSSGAIPLSHARGWRSTLSFVCAVRSLRPSFCQACDMLGICITNCFHMLRLRALFQVRIYAIRSTMSEKCLSMLYVTTICLRALRE